MIKMTALALGTLVLAGAAGVATVRAAHAVETPPYTTEVVEDDFELRVYPDMVVASVARDGSRQSAVRRAFSPLADYIFAKNRSGDKIAMTAPVTQEPGPDGWTVSFIMPNGRSLDDLPQPAGDVTLQEIAPRSVAAVRFSGRWSDRRFKDQTRRLLDWIEARGLRPVGPAEYAYYNDPFTPAFLRRNEVLIEVARD